MTCKAGSDYWGGPRYGIGEFPAGMHSLDHILIEVYLFFGNLTQAGFDVKIFERDSVPGGNWHYNLLSHPREHNFPVNSITTEQSPHWCAETIADQNRFWKSLTPNVPAVCFILFSEVYAILTILSAIYTGRTRSSIDMIA
jgi:hypothetical protein